MKNPYYIRIEPISWNPKQKFLNVDEEVIINFTTYVVVMYDNANTNEVFLQHYVSLIHENTKYGINTFQFFNLFSHTSFHLPFSTYSTSVNLLFFVFTVPLLS